MKRKQWECAVLVLLYKKNREDDPNSYRAILLLSNFPKIIERAMIKLTDVEYESMKTILDSNVKMVLRWKY